MELKVFEEGSVSVIHCSGSLDSQSVGDFKKVAYDLVVGGKSKIVVDLSDLNFIDSIGLGTLVSLLRRARENKGDVKVAALSNDVKTIFEITRLHKLFDVHPDWQTAVKRF